MGSPEQTAAFRQRHDLPFLCLSDPQKRAYQAFRLARGSAWQIAGPANWAGGLKALVRGGVGVPQGDVLQMPGAFVIDPLGRLRYVHYSDKQVDRPSHEAMMAAMRNAAEARDQKHME